MDIKQEKGIFRFSIIAPMVNHTHGFDTTEQYLDFASQKVYHFQGKDFSFSKSCIRNWFTNYQKYGIQALEDKYEVILNLLENYLMKRFEELKN